MTGPWPRSNPADHEPPAVVGHPKDNSPAFGWVDSVRKVVKNGAAVLEAKFKDLAPEFVQAVKDGRYKKRSAAFYKDGRLRHVGFLGGMPPAVKGLAPIEFEDNPDVVTFEFSETPPADVPPDDEQEIEETEMSITQEQLDAAVAKIKAEKDAEIKAAKEKASAAEARFTESETARKKKDNEAFLNGLVETSKITPGMKKNLAAFMEALDGLDETITFAEGDNEQDMGLKDAFKKVLGTFTAHPLFKEMAPPPGDGEGGEFSDGEDFYGLTAHV